MPVCTEQSPVHWRSVTAYPMNPPAARGQVHFLHADFVRVFRHGLLLRDATEHFVIYQFLDCRVLTAHWALRVAPQFQLLEFHIQCVEQKQAAN